MKKLDLRNIDPEWAWSPYEPDAETPWNVRRAAHLYRRAGFAADWGRIQQAADSSPQKVVDQLLESRGEPDDFQREIEQLASSVLAGGKASSLPAWWLYRMQQTPAQLLEKMTLFWHGHFATSADKVTDARAMYAQNELLRRHALGNFSALVQEISRDPAMLLYLDSDTNRKSHPNENYAREVMELFCLGEGEYTENDIRELARCFTGWELRRGKFRFNRYQHDFGSKTLFGRGGEFGGEDGVRIILEQPAAPRFIAQKLVRFFVFDEPAMPPNLIAPLADEFRRRDLNIAVLVRRILGSRLFFSDAVIGRKIRSPVELALGLLRALEGTTNVYELADGVAPLGQRLFYPPNVKGWEGGRAWVNSSTLLGRANLVRSLLDSDKTRFARGDLQGLLESHGVSGDEEVVDWLARLLLAVDLPQNVREKLIAILAESAEDRPRRIARVVHALGALPEFQLA